MDDFIDSFGLSDPQNLFRSSTTDTAPAPSESGWASGLLQQAMAIGGQYVNRRLDIDLAQRLTGSQPQPYRGSNQGGMAPPGADLTTRGAATIGSLKLGDMLPFLAVGVVLFMVLGKR
nr:hypothetical protein [uncultured Roseateles sp.]